MTGPRLGRTLALTVLVTPVWLTAPAHADGVEDLPEITAAQLRASVHDMTLDVHDIGTSVHDIRTNVGELERETSSGAI